MGQETDRRRDLGQLLVEIEVGIEVEIEVGIEVEIAVVMVFVVPWRATSGRAHVCRLFICANEACGC
jgi:hypothetical protein